MADSTPENVEAWLTEYQAHLCEEFERFEPSKRFEHDKWQRAEGGGGVTAVLSDGEVFERAGVARSVIRGTRLPPSATQRNPQLAGRPWRAMGVSVVVHPRNPHAPTAHMNVRLFSTDDDEPIWWFGGGFDLTPIYGYTEDCVHWHQTARDLCANFGDTVYADYKRACDEYFYLPHRGEARGGRLDRPAELGQHRELLLATRAGQIPADDRGVEGVPFGMRQDRDADAPTGGQHAARFEHPHGLADHGPAGAVLELEVGERENPSLGQLAGGDAAAEGLEHIAVRSPAVCGACHLLIFRRR